MSNSLATLLALIVEDFPDVSFKDLLLTTYDDCINVIQTDDAGSPVANRYYNTMLGLMGANVHQVIIDDVSGGEGILNSADIQAAQDGYDDKFCERHPNSPQTIRGNRRCCNACVIASGLESVHIRGLGKYVPVSPTYIYTCSMSDKCTCGKCSTPCKKEDSDD